MTYHLSRRGTPVSAAFADSAAAAIPIWFVTKSEWPSIREGLPEAARNFARSSGFEPSPGACLPLPGGDGAIAHVLFGIEEAAARTRDPMLPGKLATSLPAGVYRFANAPHDVNIAALAFLLALYRFDKYRSPAKARASLVAPDSVDAAKLERLAAAIAFGRDLVNTPANELTPEALERAASDLAQSKDARLSVTRGADLLARGLPLIHAVGRAASEEPRLVDFTWGREGAPRVTLVGKGVVFDTGGLDIKPASGMELMKKDMGGAATALSLARMIMDGGLDLHLRVLIPIVENSISASAFRPGDIYRSRKGLTVEIGNTDAEGRLILADALALADEDAPDLMMDFATLTGAARVALGPDLPPFYTDDETLAADIARASVAERDPLWRMPLWGPYDAMTDGKISDLTNSPSSPFAGSITAALFLRRFVEKAKSWAHFDVYAWNPQARSHAPQGGEVQAARALLALLEGRYGRGSS
jgi:leucyl aminopeptidase